MSYRIGINNSGAGASTLTILTVSPTCNKSSSVYMFRRLCIPNTNTIIYWDREPKRRSFKKLLDREVV